MSRFEICVVGAGPRGLCVVERICANAALIGRPVLVHLVDPYVGRGGRVWAIDQPASLLMNTIASQITMFTDGSVDMDGPIVAGPSLYEWALMEPFETYPAEIQAQARELGPDSYPTRAFYGHYLNWVLRRLCRTAPNGVAIRTHDRQAVAVDDAEDGSQIVTLADGTRLSGLAAVVLAQGHVEMPLGGEERALSRFAAERGLRYLPPANPADVDLSGVRPGEPVGLRGMGLTFFDYLTLLAQDRGGRFERVGERLRYHPSGREPVIYAGSRRGVPYHARGENEKGVFGRHEPVFLTAEVIARFRARGPAMFQTEVWPLIAREVELVYYSTMITERFGADVAAEFRSRYKALGLSTCGSLLSRFGIGVHERWSWERIARPHGDRRFANAAEFHRWLLALLADDVAAARTGNLSSCLKAALDVLRDIRNEVRLVVDHGGLTGVSYRDELRAWYTPLNAYLSIGPPVQRIEEMIALIEAGVLRVVGPGMQVSPGVDSFTLGSSAVDGSWVVVRTLIEARLPEVDIRRTSDRLLRHLKRAGACGAFRIADYETGGLAVTERPYHLLDGYGRPHPRRFAYGVPTESVHWVTAAGIRPGVNSVILGDADAIARAALAVRTPPMSPALVQTAPRRA
jgi:L-aspartate N-monooxygenase (nitrosuccinate-forming)